MQTQNDIRKVLDAVAEADPNLDDETLSAIYETLRWVLALDHGSADNFTEMFVAEL